MPRAGVGHGAHSSRRARLAQCRPGRSRRHARPSSTRRWARPRTGASRPPSAHGGPTVPTHPHNTAPHDSAGVNQVPCAEPSFSRTRGLLSRGHPASLTAPAQCQAGSRRRGEEGSAASCKLLPERGRIELQIPVHRSSAAQLVWFRLVPGLTVQLVTRRSGYNVHGAGLMAASCRASPCRATRP